MPVVTITDPGPGSWTPPAGLVNPVTVECWGGGAGNSSGNGGGGGAYSRMTLSAHIGTACDYFNGIGSDLVGEDTEFFFSQAPPIAPIQMFAKGGNGRFGGSSAESLGDVTFSGGNSGAPHATPGGGAAAGTSNDGANGSGATGGIGSNGGGSGGDSGQAGQQPGGGGGFGAVGGNGKIIITYSIALPATGLVRIEADASKPSITAVGE